MTDAREWLSENAIAKNKLGIQGNDSILTTVSRIASWMDAFSADLRGENERLRKERGEAILACQCAEGTLSMTVARLEGMVEGRPTARHNFLQRVDELVAKESALAKLREAAQRAEAELRELERYADCREIADELALLHDQEGQ